ncbi:MAG: hypothetical protein K0S01_2431 [Herbinix sp.]|jgi:DNA polymerase III delta prime subunit|nr:hypothetical protein [Herbinix sp.]
MAMINECGKESMNPVNIIRYIKYRFKFHMEHPDYMEADGLLIFVGPQGSGKTLSGVNYVYKLMEMYPKAILVTNLLLTKYPVVTIDDYKENKINEINDLIDLGHEKTEIDYIMYTEYMTKNRVFPFNDNDDFKKYENGEFGVIYFVDEIQLYLNSLESKNINMEVVTEISQQRKQRKHIVSTSQVFGRMAKPLREQFSNVVMCRKYFGCVQRNSLIDRDSIETDSSADTQIKGKVRRNFFWFHNPEEMYNRYDTYYKIIKGKFVAGEKQQKEGMYNDGIKLSISN